MRAVTWTEKVTWRSEPQEEKTVSFSFPITNGYFFRKREKMDLQKMKKITWCQHKEVEKVATKAFCIECLYYSGEIKVYSVGSKTEECLSRGHKIRCGKCKEKITPGKEEADIVMHFLCCKGKEKQRTKCKSCSALIDQYKVLKGLLKKGTC